MSASRQKLNAHQYALLCGVTVLSICSLVIIGWHFDIQFLKTILNGHTSMKFNTAVELMLFALVSILLSRDQQPKGYPKIAANFLVSFAATIGIATLVEYAFHINLGIDELVYLDLDGLSRFYPPGRLAPITAISGLLLSTAIYLAFMKGRPLYRTSQSIMFIVGMMSLQAVVSYALGVQTSFGLAAHSRIALHTAFCFIALSSAFLALQADQGLVKIVLTKTHGGISARRLLLAGLIVPPLVNMFESIGYHAGYYDADFGILLRVIGSMIFFVLMVLRNTEYLHHADQEASRLTEEKASALAREEFKAEFLARMSHEIRTPLNGIIGISDMLAEMELSATQRKYVETLQASGNGLLSIINEILDFSKIEAGKLELENVDFEFKAIVQNQVELLSRRATEKGLKLALVVEPGIPDMVNGDQLRLGQVLINLLSNAIKFTDQGSVEVRVTRLEHADSRLVSIKICVRDSGIGLKLETQKKLFRPFMQADSSTSRKFGGTGLGLSISHALVERMGGQIGVESAEGKGSNFWFSLDLKHSLAAVPSATPASPRNPATKLFTPEQHVRVLVAEDNLVNQMVVMEHLRQLGLDGQKVSNGIEALAAIKLREFDLILMDCQMPEMDGYTATAAIRAEEKFTGKRIPIVALTANAMKEDKAKCLEVGMDDYLTKPFKRDELITILSRWIRRDSNAA